MLKRNAATVLFLCIFLPLFAGGGKDTVKTTVEKPDSWQENIDISGKKQGKYNILATATDRGGNIALAGPFNIWIDPDSDLPVTGITNPLADMRVSGNLNIVGTCIDDDGVARVEVILDGNTARTVTAEGTEFWSLYLDTTELEEGPHTISVYGIDINGVKGKAQTVIWNLDRRTPLTKVDNYGLGTLVSGKITLKGIIQDGNGIESLSYSLDGGKSFTSLKIQNDKAHNTSVFALPLDTVKMEDGPGVCWFKAVDKQGSAGLYTFLYFADNTSPSVKIVLPAATDEVSGIFSAAGYAFDTIGLVSLSWKLAKDTGDFELIPGNPYWTHTFDLRNQNIKSAELEIIAVDTAGNSTTAKQKLTVNQEADKPLVTVRTPSSQEVFFGVPRLEGTATDGDGIAAVWYSLDGTQAVKLASAGVFGTDIAQSIPLSAGKHTLKVWAEDRYEVQGNPEEISFAYAGTPPLFEEQNLTYNKNGAKEKVPYMPGMEIHPESGAVLSGRASAHGGITSLSWKFSGMEETQLPVKNAVQTMPFTIPFPQDIPYGSVELTLTVNDIYGRKTEKKLLFNITNLAKLRGKSAVIFTDSAVSPEGEVLLNPSHPVSGYFTGGIPVSVSFVPETSFASVRLQGNSIIIEASSVQGTSEPVCVRVVADTGLTAESRPLVFRSPGPKPVITFNTQGLHSAQEPVVISGRITSAFQIEDCEYRIFGSVKGDIRPFIPGADGNFSFTIDGSEFENGMSVVELRAADAQGAAAYAPVFVRKAGEQRTAAGAAAPVFSWIEAGNLYYTVFSDETLFPDKVTINGAPAAAAIYAEAGAIGTEGLPAGSIPVRVTVRTAGGKTYSSSYTYKKSAAAHIRFESADGEPYVSGMPVLIPYGESKENRKALRIVIESELSPVSAQYSVNGAAPVKSAVRKTAEENAYELEIPLTASLPADILQITVTAEIKDSPPVSAAGSIAIVRPKDPAFIFDTEGLFWFEGETSGADAGGFTVSPEAPARALYNGGTPASAAFAGTADGFSVLLDGNIITVTAEKDGARTDSPLTVTRQNGTVYSKPGLFTADFSAPELLVQVPESVSSLSPGGPARRDSGFPRETGVAPRQSSGGVLALTGTASDKSGIVSVEYSTDGGTLWHQITADSGTDISFSANIPLDSIADGFIPFAVRTRDGAGRETTVRRAVLKDTQPPEVTVILPAAGDIVNGETSLVFYARDAFSPVSAEYLNKDGTSNTADTRFSSTGPIITALIGTFAIPLSDDMSFRFTDAAGNETIKNTWDFIIDPESDLPQAQIHLPEENAVIRRDFVISGIVYDDDGPAKIYYRIDDSPFVPLAEYASSFSIPVSLSSMTDNEHTVTVYAEDIRGVRGDMVSSSFRISLEEPKGQVNSPGFDKTVKGTVQISGTASDENGIEKIQISLDNGNSFNDAAGTEDWTYTFDSNVIQDGTHVIFLKVWDKYGIEGLYSSLINIDNTPPEISLELPLDDTRTSGPLFFSGQTIDNIDLQKLYVHIRGLSAKQPAIPAALAEMELVPDRIIARSLDLSVLSDGFYNIELTGEDAAGNTTRVSRNIQVDKTLQGSRIEFLYPLNGEHVQGMFNIYGKIVSEKPVETLLLYIDEENAGVTEPTASGYFKFTITPEHISGGSHYLVVRGLIESDKVISSDKQYIMYTSGGPWITIDNFTMGDFAIERPYLEGSAGYSFTESDITALKAKDLSKSERDALAAKSVERVEISFDNGKTFTKADSTKKWRYRIEAQDMAQGYHFLVVRAIMKNGETAVTRSIIQIDKTPPVIRLIAPAEGGRFNDEIIFSGLASDDIKLDSVNLALRSGDKAAYEVPSFIQGLYFDWHFWGATLYDIGLGLTFFDDNVKLQFQFGQFTEAQRTLFTDSKMRYGGNVVGMKLLANLAYIPFRYFFGPDWAWLSANAALGANFSMFFETQSGKPQILSAILAQIEFPRITIPKQKVFRTFSFYTELQLWFIPTDVASGGIDITSVLPQISGGIRVNVF